MENLIQLKKGAKAYGSKLLFEDASFAINEGEHVGVIGPNGAGKTTLFRAIIGEEELDSGELVRSRILRLGYLAQNDDWREGETIEEYITRDGRTPIWELKALGRGLGLAEDVYERPVKSFSGGYRMRAKLLRLIAGEPNLMLLDEPTNYLDLETLMVLEKFLQSYAGAFLVISHDREFLRRTTDHTLEVEGGEITKYNGDIDDYFEQKQMIREQLESRAMSLQEKRKQILDFVARFGAKATKASQAQSRLKSLEKMEQIEVKPLPVSAKIRIPPPARVGRIVLQGKSLQLGYGEKRVLENVSLQVAGGDHLAVVGLNGAGKSTLLKALAGRLPPQAGSIEFGYEVTMAYFAQHVAEELSPEHTVLQSLNSKAHPSVLPQQVLDLAGSLLFSGDDVHKPIRVLSGGERSRVALGQVLLQKASCLILDEPTNHLDFQTVEALTQALHEFEGSLVVVSHDRGFIRRIGTKILEISQGQAATYPGSYDDYVWSVEKGAFATIQGTKSAAKSSPSGAASAAAGGGGANSAGAEASGASFNYKERKKALDRRLRQLENTIADCDKKLTGYQARIDAINHELASPTGAASANAAKLVQEMGQVQKQLEECEALWMSSAEERDQVLKDLAALTGA